MLASQRTAGLRRRLRDTVVADYLLAAGAGEGSRLHKKHKIYLQIVTVATVPEGYEERLVEIQAGQFAKLRLFVLEPHDLVLSKLVRNSEVDAEDVRHLIQSLNLDLDLIKTRYSQELRP